MKKYIAYYRVSTAKQGSTGLGIQAQQYAVANYVSGKGTIVESYTEVETGTRKKKRVEIYKAIEHAKKLKACLVISKLDRLSRDCEFTGALFNSGVEFIATDNPFANKLTIQILSAIAEHEAEAISTRIKEALNQKKANIAAGNITNKDGSKMKKIKGVYRLGSPKGFGAHQQDGPLKVKENARLNTANIQAMDIICAARNQGQTYQAIADKLNKLKYTTRYGKQFNPIQVQRLFKRRTE